LESLTNLKQRSLMKVITNNHNGRILFRNRARRRPRASRSYFPAHTPSEYSFLSNISTLAKSFFMTIRLSIEILFLTYSECFTFLVENGPLITLAILISFHQVCKLACIIFLSDSFCNKITAHDRSASLIVY
jgi:hypothetical protein